MDKTYTVFDLSTTDDKGASIIQMGFGQLEVLNKAIESTFDFHA
jgi:hypothetical protein